MTRQAKITARGAQRRNDRRPDLPPITGEPGRDQGTWGSNPLSPPILLVLLAGIIVARPGGILENIPGW
ncbi:MAG TPA: hypothetical protein VN837_07550 [Chloroflexota bacterium]|nr:hypothetical protein [Chloroflexota bacterium]